MGLIADVEDNAQRDRNAPIGEFTLTIHSGQTTISKAVIRSNLEIACWSASSSRWRPLAIGRGRVKTHSSPKLNQRIETG